MSDNRTMSDNGIMSEKWLYFFNILVSRWVNALNCSGQRAPIKSILVVKWDEIGDMAAAVHVFGALKSSYPDIELHVLCKPFVSSLIAGDPAIDRVFTDISGWQQRYDAVVELRGTWKTLWKSLLLRTMPKYRVDRGWIRFVQRSAQPPEVITNARIIAPLLAEKQPISARCLYPSEAEIAEAGIWSDWAMSSGQIFGVSNSGLLDGNAKNPSNEVSEEVNSNFPGAFSERNNDATGYAILHTGARRELRRWPLERFVALSKWLLSEKKLIPIWVGTADEESQLDDAFVMGAAGKKWVAPAGSSLLSFYAFIASSRLYVGNESGPLQLADIAEVPLVAIYGPGVPNVFYPLSARSLVLQEVLDCNPCDQIHCVRPSDRCIDRISLASVQLAVSEVLS